MPTSFARPVILGALIGALLFTGCSNRRGGSAPDTGPTGDSTTVDSGSFDSGPDTSTIDSGLDTSTIDSSRPADSGRTDSATPIDSGRTDSGSADSALPDSGFPTDSGLLPDAGICILGMAKCPVGQTCCELFPGTGFGTCAATCP